MANRQLDRGLKIARRSAFRGRSPAYRYIREHFGQLTSVGFGSDDGPAWQVLAEILSIAKQVNRYGQPLTGPAVAALFKRVQRDVERERSWMATGIKRPRNQTSRAASSWQPPIAQPASQQPMAASPPTRPEAPVQQPIDPDDPPPGSPAYVRRQLAKMSGR